MTNKLSENQIKILETHYETILKRILHEHDQRDRDFSSYVTMNAGLFAAVGFVVNWIDLKYVAGSLVTSGIYILFLGVIGVVVGQRLQGSIQHFTYWENFLNKSLAEIERRILPDSNLGLSTKIIAAENKPTAIADHREKLANNLIGVWQALCGVGISLVFTGSLYISF